MNVEYWIWLQNTFGVKARIDDMLAYFKSPKNLFDAGSYEWRISGVLTPKQIELLENSSLDNSHKIMAQCQKNNIQIITPEDDNYPILLKNLPDFPAVLYSWGDISCVNDTICISVVGTRKASKNSFEVASNLSYSLAKAGATVISGAAVGIDTAAHSGALQAGGKTVAVLGCGLLDPYLPSNKPLRNQIEKSGAVISEYPPTQNATRATFPIRNRIISGMSLGTVVIEAGEKSGSLITASLALSQGRDVFAVPGDIISSSYTGANMLIRDGARPVFCAMDVLEEYDYVYPNMLDLSQAQKPVSKAIKNLNLKNSVYKNENKACIKHSDIEIKQEQKPVVRRNIAGSVSEIALQVYEQISDKPLNVNDIALKTGLETSEILGALIELELLEYVELQQGRKYTLK